MKYIPYAHQDISEQDIQAVIEVLKSDWLTQGPSVEAFEQKVAAYCGTKYAVAVNSATSALHIACLAAGLTSGDALWTSPNTFVASANCGLYCGAAVDFVDIDPKSYNISVSLLEEKLACVAQEKLPKIVIPVHFSGQSCEMEAIDKLAKKYHFMVIEDASHAIGGTYQGKRVGCCQFSDMTVFSFHPAKIVTTAEGGMVLTNNEALYNRLVKFRCHGITRDPSEMVGESQGPWYYQQVDLGYNYRMTDVHAILGLSQMKRIDEFVARRRDLAKRYDQLLADLPLTCPWQHDEAKSSYHLYVIRLQLENIRRSHREVFEYLRAANIGVNLHYIPVHTQPYYQQLGFHLGDFAEAECYYKEAISLPMYYGLTEQQQDYIIATIKEAVQ